MLIAESGDDELLCLQSQGTVYAGTMHRQPASNSKAHKRTNAHNARAFHCLTYGQHAFSLSGPVVWNSLP